MASDIDGLFKFLFGSVPSYNENKSKASDSAFLGKSGSGSVYDTLQGSAGRYGYTGTPEKDYEKIIAELQKRLKYAIDKGENPGATIMPLLNQALATKGLNTAYKTQLEGMMSTAKQALESYNAGVDTKLEGQKVAEEAQGKESDRLKYDVEHVASTPEMVNPNTTTAIVINGERLPVKNGFVTINGVGYDAKWALANPTELSNQSQFASSDVASEERVARQKQIDKNAAPSQPKQDTVSEAPTYDFQKTPEMQKYEDIINSRLIEAPEFTPEMVTKWKETLNAINAPFEEQAMGRVGEAFSAASPLSFGSGKQMEATRDLIKEQEANKAATALAMGKEEFAYKKSDYENALTRSIALNEYYQQAKNLKTDQERQDFWTQKQREWGLEDVQTGQNFARETASTQRNQQLEDQKTQDEQYWKRLMEQEDFTLSQQEQADKKQMKLLLLQRGWTLADALTARNQELENYEIQKNTAQDIAKTTQPKDVPWWQSLLAPIAQGVGYAVGGPVGGAVGSGIANFFGSKSASASTTAGPIRPVETPYDYTKPYTPVNYWDSYKVG